MDLPSIEYLINMWCIYAIAPYKAGKNDIVFF
jgi:hypothetical protein